MSAPRSTLLAWPRRPLLLALLSAGLCSAAPVWAADADLDGFPDELEASEGLNPAIKDNNIYAESPQGRRLFVMQQFRDVLYREGSASAITYWTNKMNSEGLSRTNLILAFLNSGPATTQIKPLGRLMMTYFGNVFLNNSFNGMVYWGKQLSSGAMTLDQISVAFANSAAFTNKYGSLSDSQFIDQIYLNTLNRVATVPEQSAALSQISSTGRGPWAKAMSEQPNFVLANENRLFVELMFAGLGKRSPTASGEQFWLDKLATNVSAGQAEMINAYLGVLLPNYAGAAKSLHDRFLPSDSAPPATPGQPVSGLVTGQSVQFSWPISSDDVAIEKYVVRRDGTVLGETANNFWVDNNLNPSSNYSYTVQAVDTMQQSSGLSPALNVSTLAAGKVAHLFYAASEAGWNTVNVHHNANNLVWTTAPGQTMDGVCGAFRLKNLSMGNLNKFQAAFNNGSGVWDNFNNQGGVNYDVPPGNWLVRQHKLYPMDVNPCLGQPYQLTANSIGSTSLTLRWQAPVSMPNLLGFDVFGNGQWLGSTSNTQLQINGLIPNTAYSFSLRARYNGYTAPMSPALQVATLDSGANAERRLGVQYSSSASTFRLWSPDSSNVQLVLNNQSYAMTKQADGNGYTNIYAVTVPGDHALEKYHFVVNGSSSRDPYGVMVEPGTNNNVVLNLASTEPDGGWAAAPSQLAREDAVIYEVHVRDFTWNSNSGVDAAKRGRFLGMVQAGTTYNGEKTGIDHLVDLGVTHVQLLPFYDYGSCPSINGAINDNCYNWGYDPVNYNVPEERYSSNPLDYNQRVKELKTMVNEFHKRGIRVVMDVVYNHTLNTNVLGDISGQYYFPLDLSGVGNSINTRNPMVSRFIRDSLEYWAREYHIDGFRFDLAGIFDYEAVRDWGNYLNSKYPDRNLMMYGEPWNGFATDPWELDRVRNGTVGNIVESHFGIFNSSYRGALKGNGDDGSGGGFIFNQGSTWANAGTWPGSSAKLGPISVGMAGSPRYLNQSGTLADLWDAMFSLDPEQSINYIDAHDNLCLNDKVDAWAALNGASANTGLKRRVQELGLTSVLLAQGVPFLHGGSEILRTKGGDKNSYASPDSVNQYNWAWKVSNKGSFDWVKKIIALRRNHPALRLGNWTDVRNNVSSDQQSASLVVTSINGAAVGDSWGKILILQNSGAASVNYSLPAGNWQVAVENDDVNAGNDRVVTGSVSVGDRSVSVLHQ